jgi:hypothetical protein
MQKKISKKLTTKTSKQKVNFEETLKTAKDSLKFIENKLMIMASCSKINLDTMKEKIVRLDL